MARVSGLPGGPASGLGVLLVTGSDAALLVCYPRVLGAASPVCGDRDEVSSSANPGALDGQLWQLSGQRVRVPQRTPGDASKKH